MLCVYVQKGAHGVDDVLAQALHSIEIGRPVSYGLLHVFPLRGGIPEEGDISLLEDARWAETLRIEELHGASGVPGLRVVNEGTTRVLLLEGDELVGDGQNHVVNSSVLLAARSELVLPVSCVGRWSYRPRAFSPENGEQHLALRGLKTRSVHDSLRRGRVHRSDQRGLWRAVDHRTRLHGAASPACMLQDAGGLSQRLDPFGKLARELPQGTSGVVVAIGERLALLEVLAGPYTFARTFRKLLSGYAFESIGLDRPYGTPDTATVRDFIHAAAGAALEEHRPAGAGRDVQVRAEGLSGYALLGERGVLHAVACAG